MRRLAHVGLSLLVTKNHRFLATLLAIGLIGACTGPANAWEAKYEAPERGVRLYDESGNYTIVTRTNGRLVTWCHFDRNGTFLERFVLFEHRLVVERWPSGRNDVVIEYQRPLKPLWPLKPGKSVVNRFKERLPGDEVLDVEARFTVGRRQKIRINGQDHSAVMIKGRQVRYVDGARIDTLVVEKAYLLAYKVTIVLSASQVDPTIAVDYSHTVRIERPGRNRRRSLPNPECLPNSS